MSTTLRQTSENRPVRILHVLGGMDRGGAETWLMHVLRHVDRSRFQMDFAVNLRRRCAYDAEIEALGSKIYPCPNPSNPLRYAINFRKILRQHGPYDVVHSHVHHYSGFVLLLARKEGVPNRIAHSHNDTRLIDGQSSFLRHLYLRTAENWIAKHATIKLAASIMAANSLFGSSWKELPGASLLYCGIDLKPFDAPARRSEYRAALNLSPDDFVVGHVGRFVPQKNHGLLIRVHQELLRIQPNAKLLLVGKGPLEEPVRATVQTLGLEQSIRFAGVREDIPNLMLSAMDVFVLPSLYEGLGLVAIEAQAAGLPTILSSSVPPEADLAGGLVQFVSPQAPPRDWARAIVNQHKTTSASARQTALELVKKSPFAIEHSAADLCHAYLRGLPLSNATT